MNYPLLTKKIGAELGAILGLSLALGAVFNSSNPIGVHWTPAPEPLVASAAPPANHSSSNSSPWSVTSTHWPVVKPLLEAGKLVLVDSRPKKTFELYHIPGAVSLPYDSNDEDLHAFQQKYDTNQHLVVYCAGGSCSAATMLTAKLLPLGYKKLQIMEEGYFGWLGQTQNTTNPAVSISKSTAPVVTSTPSTPASHANQAVPSEHAPDPPIAAPDDTQAPNPSPTTWALTKPLFMTGKVVLVDVRATQTFKAGHVPGAVSLPESSAKPEDYSAFRSKYDPNRMLVLYCSSITCSVSKRVALRLASEYGFRNVRYMTGGFQEWQKAELSSAQSKS